MAWSTSNRRATLPPDWDTIRLPILIRDHYQCQHVRTDTGRICGAHTTQVDHIDPDGGDQPANLRALCTWHHRIKSSSEGGRAKAAAAARPAALHPGIRPG